MVNKARQYLLVPPIESGEYNSFEELRLFGELMAQQMSEEFPTIEVVDVNFLGVIANVPRTISLDRLRSVLNCQVISDLSEIKVGIPKH